MKIVDLATFLAYPDGVVFAEYDPCIIGEIEVRGDVWMYDKLSNCCYQRFSLFGADNPPCGLGTEGELETDVYSRTGPGLNEKQLFAVFDKKDISVMINRLQRALDEAKE